MREIKFRAWDKEEKIMINADSLAFEEYAPISLLFADAQRTFEVMQYTGLKDKNGMGLTEVFEGDIMSEDGILKGNIYENDKRETDIVVPQLGTKDWETTYKEIVVRGYDYSE